MLLDRHRAKIVAEAQLLAAVGPRPRDRTVVVCNGVFDVVHPGHLRHLAYASTKANILVCVVTSDRYVGKGPYRPHVPQELRAANLAMLDIVDYVVVNDAERPDGFLQRVQPDFYAKGFEYAERPSGPIGEAGVVEGYGGQVLFTPGDVVYSSSALIEAGAPDLRWDKLAEALRRYDITFGGLRATLARFKEFGVHVVGDLIVDRLSYCDVVGAQAKTPTISVRRERSEDFVGGAGIVARHACAAGAQVVLDTVIGDDDLGRWAERDLENHGVRVRPLVDPARPTTLKEVVLAGGYRLLKIDVVDNRPISDEHLRRLSGLVRTTTAEALIYSDFRHGIFNPRTIPELTTAAMQQGVLRVADSQVASRWGNVSEFAGFDLLTPNEREARFALGDQDSGVRSLGAHLREVARCRYLLMKLGARGLIGFGPDDDSFVLDSFVREVVDPVGAGDAFLAYATLALLDRPDMPAVAAILGSMAAACECGYAGNRPVAPAAVEARIDEAEREIG